MASITIGEVGGSGKVAWVKDKVRRCLLDGGGNPLNICELGIIREAFRNPVRKCEGDAVHTERVV